MSEHLLDVLSRLDSYVLGERISVDRKDVKWLIEHARQAVGAGMEAIRRLEVLNRMSPDAVPADQETFERQRLTIAALERELETTKTALKARTAEEEKFKDHAAALSGHVVALLDGLGSTFPADEAWTPPPQKSQADLWVIYCDAQTSLRMYYRDVLK